MLFLRRGSSRRVILKSEANEGSPYFGWGGEDDKGLTYLGGLPHLLAIKMRNICCISLEIREIA
jgi:hypothetical protein